MGPFDEASDRVGITLHNCLYGAIRTIANPTGEAE